MNKVANRKAVGIIFVGIILIFAAGLLVYLQFNQPLGQGSYSQWAGLSSLASLTLACALLVWGSWIALSSKKISGWWSLLLLIMITGWGAPFGIFLPIIFLCLKGKAENFA